MEELKIAVREFVIEGCDAINKWQLPLKNWLWIEINDDDVIGWHWFPKQETRLDLVSLSFFFARETPPFRSSELILQTLEQDQTLMAKLHKGGREVEGWHISELHLKVDIWKSVLGPYVGLCWARHKSLAFDQEIFETIWGNHIAHLKPPAVTTEHRLFPLTNLKIGSEKIELEPGLIIRPLLPEEIETWLNSDFLLFDKKFRIDEINHLQCAIEATYPRPSEYYSLPFSPEIIRQQLEWQRSEATTISRALSTLRLVTNVNTTIPFEQTHSRGLLHQEMTATFRQARIFSSYLNVCKFREAANEL